MSDYQGIIDETPGLITAVNRYNPTPTTPSGTDRPNVKRLNLKCDVVTVKALPDVLEREYKRFKSWSDWMFAGPIDNIRRNIGPWGDGKSSYSNFDFRWLTHWSFPHKFIGRIFRYRWTVERVAQVYVDLYETSKYDIVDKNLLERTLSPGLVMADTLWFADNLDVPVVARAYKLCMAFFELHEARVKRDADANRKEVVERMHPMYHPTAAWMLYWYGKWSLTGDKQALKNYQRIAAQFVKGYDYVTLADGTEIVLIPHFVIDWANEIRSEKVSFPAGAQDATYCETFMELAISLYWAGADVIDERFLAAYANTMMLTIHSEGYGNGSEMAEAMCGSVPKDKPAQNNQLRGFTIKGEAVKTTKVSSNRTTTRQHSISSRRAGMHAGVPYATKKDKRKAPAYHDALEQISNIDKKLGPPATWKLASLAQFEGYKVTERAA